jgi:hypothetical protein
MKLAARIATGAVIIGAGLASCTESTVVCTTEGRFSVVVTVVDSVTSQNAAPGATLIVQKPSGEVEGTMQGPTAFPQLFAGDEAGTFNVSVSKPSYTTWTRNGVVVSADRCGKPNTVTLLARLVSSAP